MKLGDEECRLRLAEGRHGVLATRHPQRGVDAVPVVYALIGSQLVLPLDTVKSKRSGRLRRLDNLAVDDRCVLLVEHYDDDWSKLWWVRVHGRAMETPSSPEALAALAERYPPYRRDGSVVGMLVLTPHAISGWEP